MATQPEANGGFQPIDRTRKSLIERTPIGRLSRRKQILLAFVAGHLFINSCVDPVTKDPPPFIRWASNPVGEAIEYAWYSSKRNIAVWMDPGERK